MRRFKCPLHNRPCLCEGPLQPPPMQIYRSGASLLDIILPWRWTKAWFDTHVLYSETEADTKRQYNAYHALKAENEELRKALQPFAEHGIDEDVGASSTELLLGLMRDRIVDWFGPSDFITAREAYFNKDK